METTITGLTATVYDNIATFENISSSVYLREETIERLLDDGKVVWSTSAVVRDEEGPTDYLWLNGNEQHGYGSINEEDLRRALDELQSTDNREQQVREWVEENVMIDHDKMVECIVRNDNTAEVKVLLVPAFGGDEYHEIEQEDGVRVIWIGANTEKVREFDNDCVEVNLRFDDDFQPE